MKSRKLTALLMTTALCATALFGCGDDEKDTTTKAPSGNEPTVEDEEITATIKVWSPSEDQAPDQGEWLQTMCEQFNTDHPKWTLTFEYETCSEGDAGQTVSQDPSAAADVYMFASDQLKTLVNAQGIAKLGGDVATYIQDTNDQALVDSVTYDGAIYGIPFTTNLWVMYYDKSVFSEEDVKSLDTMLTKGKVAFPIEDAWYVQSFFLASGCTFGPDDAPAINLGGENGAVATKYMIDLVANPNFTHTGNAAEAIGKLQDGEVNAAFSGSWDLDNAKKFLGDNFAIAAIPSIDVESGSGQLQAFASSKAIAVNPNTKNMEVSVALAKYLASEEAQKSHYELRGVVPCNTALLEDPEVSNDPLFIAQNETFNNCSIIQPAYLTSDNYWTPAADFAKAITSGAVTADNAQEKVDEFNTQMNDNLD